MRVLPAWLAMLALLAAPAAVPAAGGTTFRVRPDGDNTLCDGSAPLDASHAPDCAFRDPQGCIDAMRPGDTCEILTGVYVGRETAPGEPAFDFCAVGGSAASPTVVRAAPGHAPLFCATPGCEAPAPPDAGWMIGAATGVPGERCGALRFENLTVLGGMVLRQASDVVVTGGRFHGAIELPGGGRASLWIDRSDRVRVTGSRFADLAGTSGEVAASAAALSDTPRLVFESNLVEGPARLAVSAEGAAERHVLRRNLVWGVDTLYANAEAGAARHPDARVELLDNVLAGQGSGPREAITDLPPARVSGNLVSSGEPIVARGDATGKGGLTARFALRFGHGYRFPATRRALAIPVQLGGELAWLAALAVEGHAGEDSGVGRLVLDRAFAGETGPCGPRPWPGPGPAGPCEVRRGDWHVVEVSLTSPAGPTADDGRVAVWIDERPAFVLDGLGASTMAGWWASGDGGWPRTTRLWATLDGAGAADADVWIASVGDAGAVWPLAAPGDTEPGSLGSGEGPDAPPPGELDCSVALFENGWSAAASEEDLFYDGDGVHAIDNTPVTRWISFTDFAFPKTLDLDLAFNRTMCGVQYGFFEGPAIEHGKIRDFAVYTSLDGSAWDFRATGSFPEEGTEHAVLFGLLVTARYVRLAALSSWKTVDYPDNHRVTVNELDVLATPTGGNARCRLDATAGAGGGPVALEQSDCAKGAVHGGLGTGVLREGRQAGAARGPGPRTGNRSKSVIRPMGGSPGGS